MCASLRDSECLPSYPQREIDHGPGTFPSSWDSETFVSSYVNIPIFIILYLGFKFIEKTKIGPLAEIPISHFIDIANANPEPPAKPVTGLRRFNILWS
jgi:amino acid transporter